MNQPKVKSTTRKFYNKWLYKVSIEAEGAPMFRSYSLQELVDWANSPEPEGRSYSYNKRYWHHRDNIKELATALLSYDKQLWSIRIESSSFDVYTNDPAIYNAIALQFKDIVIHQFEPNLDQLTILDNCNSVIVKKLPHDRYNYRVYLQPHKMAGDKEGKTRFVNWLKQQDKITCTPAVEQWFIKTDWNWDRRYVLVEDEQTLLMLKLRNSEVVGRVYNYVISDK